ASRAYPAEHQGIAMGIAGAGNSGTMIAVLLAPLLAQSMGWHAVFGLAMFPVVIVLLLFTFLAKEPAGRPAPSANLLGLLKQSDLWWFNFHYSVTFGGFVGLSSFLSIFFNDQYHLPAVTAGGWTALSVFAGSFFRPIGGYLADRVGGAKVRTFLYLGVMILFGSIAFLPPLPLALVLFFCGMALLGMGNGAIFQEIPQRFREEIGMVSGIVGAAGGVGGFFLPTLLGRIKGFSGSYAGGFLFFAAIAFVAFLSLVLRSRSVVEPVLAPSGGAPMEEGGRIRMEVVFGG
ncbi:MAG: MFS transporter, partial [Candidatus Manganitrophaceae bacterium]